MNKRQRWALSILGALAVGAPAPQPVTGTAAVAAVQAAPAVTPSSTPQPAVPTAKQIERAQAILGGGAVPRHARRFEPIWVGYPRPRKPLPVGHARTAGVTRQLRRAAARASA